MFAENIFLKTVVEILIMFQHFITHLTLDGQTNDTLKRFTEYAVSLN